MKASHILLLDTDLPRLNNALRREKVPPVAPAAPRP